jgi:hypothetical protein
MRRIIVVSATSDHFRNWHFEICQPAKDLFDNRVTPEVVCARPKRRFLNRFGHEHSRTSHNPAITLSMWEAERNFRPLTSAPLPSSA